MAKNYLTLAAVLGALLLLVGCGGDDSVASKSARALREAQQRGETFGGDGHAHGHGALSPPRAGESGATGGEAVGHEAVGHAGIQVAGGAAGMDHDGPQMDHGGMQHRSSGTAGGEAGHAAMGHESGAPGPGQPTDHSAMGHGAGGAAPAGPGQPATDHAAMGHGRAAGAPRPSLGAIQARTAGAPAGPVPPGAPAATLAPDPLDGPAPTSVIEAERSAAMATEMSGGESHGRHGGHGGTGSYRHVDAGRGAEAPGDPRDHEPSPGHEGHGSATPPGSGHAPGGQGGKLRL